MTHTSQCPKFIREKNLLKKLTLGGKVVKGICAPSSLVGMSTS